MVSITADFECTLFGRLPKELREKAVNIAGIPINEQTADPLDLVCIQISPNPGVTPFVVANITDFFTLFENLATNIGFNIKEYGERLSKRFEN